MYVLYLQMCIHMHFLINFIKFIFSNFIVQNNVFNLFYIFVKKSQSREILQL